MNRLLLHDHHENELIQCESSMEVTQNRLDRQIRSCKISIDFGEFEASKYAIDWFCP